MNALQRLVWISAVAGVVVLAAASGARAQDSLASARDLYAAAAYEDALVVLNRLRPAADDGGRAIQQYRAFCLLALNRGAEAQRAIEAIITEDPSYHPSDSDS